MTEWRKPEFVEIRMDAEITCYTDVIDDMRAFKPLRKSESAAEEAPSPPAPRPLP
jgi:coenzyme PQQ precursor peptide PqqA